MVGYLSPPASRFTAVIFTPLIFVTLSGPLTQSRLTSVAQVERRPMELEVPYVAVTQGMGLDVT